MSFPLLQPLDTGPSKLPIPRLERRGQPPFRPGKNRDRVPRACLSCRARKVKCNGAQPTCANCSENVVPCIYVTSRKDRLKTATEQNQDMKRLLKELGERAVGTDKAKIEDMLIGVMEDAADTAVSIQKSPMKLGSSEPDEERGEANITAEVGSNEDLNGLDEDLLRNEQSRATGFIGPSSEIQWIRRLHHEADHVKRVGLQYDGPYGPPGNSAEAHAERANAMKHRQDNDTVPLVRINSCSFHLDDEEIERDFMADPFELPQFQTAERLLKSYMENVHNSFPVLAKKTFINQFYHYYASLGRGTPYKLPQKWQATLNLVFAIGAAYSHLTEAEWRADERDHLIYHSRAWALDLKDSWWFSHPDLPQMQITGLLAFYYLAIGQINRSWVVIGISLRFGYALGLHCRNEDRVATAVKKEVLARIWWGLYSLECILSTITGRPSVGLKRYCSVSLPLPLSTEEIVEAIIMSRFGDRSKLYTVQEHLSPESSSASPTPRGFSDLSGGLVTEPANSGSYLKNTVKIGMITQKTLLDLYSANIASKSWETVQRAIVELSEDLEAWVTSLPPGFNFFQRNHDQTYQRERITLELYYHETKILITRPCLRSPEYRIENQTVNSHDFDQRTAAICVGSAKAISSLLPNNIPNDRVQLYQGPWWSMVHNITQALVVIMLEISYEAVRFPQDRQDMIPSLKKLVRCLRAMKTNNGMANRAYMITLDLLQKMVVHINIDISDLLSEDSAATTAMAIFQLDQPNSEAFTQEFSRLTQEHPQQYPSNQQNPYNYATSNPFGLSQEQAPLPDPMDTSNMFQEFFTDSLPPDSPIRTLFGNDP